MEKLLHAQPSKDEVRAQLKRILSSSHFTSRVKAKELLELLVGNALDGINLREEDIRTEIFPTPPYDPLATNVRTNMNTVRTLIKKHYETNGKDDPVIIALPKRPHRKAARRGTEDPYSVTWVYKDVENNETLFRISSKILERWSPASIRTAYTALELILNDDAKDCEALLAHIHCTCIVAVFFTNRGPKKKLIADALVMAAVLVKRRPHDWRSYVALGAASLCDGNQRTSSDALLKASSMNPDLSARGYLWLPAMFLVLGMPDPARTYISSIVHFRFDDPVVCAASGFVLYFTRDFAKSEEMFGVAKDLDETNWLVYLGLSLLYLSTERPDKAVAAYIKMSKIVGEDFPPMSGIGLRALSRSTDGWWADFTEAKITQWMGFMIEPEDRRDHLQVAIVMMDKQPKDAIYALALAVAYSQPLALLIPICPLFDPLRTDPEFQNLLNNLNFPRAE